MESKNLENASLEFDLILGAPDCRGPLQPNEPVQEDFLKDFFQEMLLEQLAKNAGTPSAATRIPSIDEILGISPAMRESYEKHEHFEDVKDMTLAKRDLSKASSGPGRVRLEKTQLAAETWLFGFDSNGEELFARPFEERKVL